MTSPKKPAPEQTEADADGTAPRAKKPYQKPAFVREQLFETMALACGKINTGGSCSQVKKFS